MKNRAIRRSPRRAEGDFPPPFLRDRIAPVPARVVAAMGSTVTN
jgi:hypothetical protein